MSEHVAAGQTVEEKAPSTIEKIEAVLAGVNGSLTAKQRWEIFEFKILSLLDVLTPAGLDAVIPTIEGCLGIRRASILKEVKELKGLTNPEGKTREKDSELQGRRAQSLVNGRLCYRTNLGWCGAGQEYIKEDKLNPLNPTYHFSTRGHIRWLDILEGRDDYPKISDVYDGIVTILNRHLVWKKPYYPQAIGLWILGTYFTCIFQWYGYLWVTSPARRCGKSLLLEIISHLAFNSTSILINPRPAYLYRTVDKDFPTVIIDELTKFKGDSGDDYMEILSLLNAGVKSNATVVRMEKIKEIFEAQYYQAYCPKALGGLVNLPDTLNDRVLKIDMIRRKKSEKVERFNIRKCGEELARLRDDLHLVGLGYDREVAEFYDSTDRLDIPKELDDRLKDITEPLFVLAGIMDAEKGNLDVAASLKSYTLELAGARGADDRADLVQHTVRALMTLEIGSGEVILTGREARELFQKEPELEWCDSPKKAGRLLNRLGFNSRPHRVGRELVRGYKISYSDLVDLRERYGEDSAGETP